LFLKPCRVLPTQHRVIQGLRLYASNKARLIYLVLACDRLWQ
jgi:hypothetical protein